MGDNGMRVEDVDPEDAESIVAGWRKMTAWSARVCTFEDGSEVVAIIYSKGPASHHKAVERLFDDQGK